MEQVEERGQGKSVGIHFRASPEFIASDA